MTRQQAYETKTTTDLKHYLGPRGLGIHPIDVKTYLNKQASIHTLTKPELIKLLLLLDKDNKGLGNLLTPQPDQQD